MNVGKCINDHYLSIRFKFQHHSDLTLIDTIRRGQLNREVSFACLWVLVDLHQLRFREHTLAKELAERLSLFLKSDLQPGINI